MSFFLSRLTYPDVFIVFFFNDTATTEIYTLSLHDALPICPDGIDFPDYLRRLCREVVEGLSDAPGRVQVEVEAEEEAVWGDRKSTRLNSSHANISYAVFCLKKKKQK